MEINVGFIEEIGEDETFVLTMGVDVYPNYRPNDIIFLEKKNREDETKSMRMTKYIVNEVIHSVREVTSRNNRTEHNWFGTVAHIGVEVYVTKALEE